MPRRFAVLCLLVAALACKSDAAPAASAAGHVTAIEGTVTATRTGEAPRKLTADSAVFADDLIATGETSEVTIVLDKNGATLKLANGTSQRVSESLAWKAPSSLTGGIAIVDTEDSTHIAGESGDRPAGTGPNAALDEKKEKNPSPPDEGGGRKFSGETAAAKLDEESPSDDDQAELGITGKGKDAPGGNNTTGSAEPTQERDKAISRTSGRIQVREIAPPKAASAADKALRKRSQAVGRCLDPITDPVTFSAAIEIGAGGAVSSVKLADHSLSEKVKACVLKVLSRKYPASLAGADVVARASFKKATE